MSNQVYANMMEVSCKAAAGKSICAFPDVCMTPPQTPATPPGVPIPYPNTGMASDTSDGSSSVKISGQEVMLKNKSSFKKSMGDEAGAAPMKGVVTSKNMGKVFFNAWSMDVKVEGENVVRMMDLTTHNHASFPGNSPTWPYIDEAAFSPDSDHPCASLANDLNEHCSAAATPFLKDDGKGAKTLPARSRKKAIKKMCSKNNKKCREAMKCVMTKKSPNNCCPNSRGKKPTPHHVVPDSQFNDSSGSRLKLGDGKEYSYNGAPCVCAQGNSHSTGKHGEIHTETNNLTINHKAVSSNNISPTGKSIIGEPRWSVGAAEDVGAQAVAKVTGCDKDCIQSQVRKGHESMGIEESDQIRPTTAGEVTNPRSMKPKRPRGRG
jgi:Toxin PAAR-like domain/GHH signature containing HNH/Endo VII superfamily nuclease toxin  2